MVGEDRDLLMSQAEADYLGELAADVGPPFLVVELGVFRGLSLKAMSEATDAWTIGIDLWAGHRLPPDYQRWAPITEANRAVAIHNAPDAMIVTADTAEAAELFAGYRVGLLHIDADHSYSGVARDFDAWVSLLAPRATVVFDDYGNIDADGFAWSRFDGVRRFVDSLPFDVDRFGKLAKIEVP